jgi:hypothetical protein
MIPAPGRPCAARIPEITRRGVVDDVVGSLGKNPLPASLCAGCSDYGEAAGTCKLRCGDAYVAAGTVDENGLASPAVCAVKERLVGCGVRHVHCRALGEGRVGWQGVHLVRAAEAEFGVSATQRATHIDAIASLDLRHTRTDHFDDTGRVRARGVGELGPAIVGVRAQIGVHRVDADGVDAHEHLGRAQPIPRPPITTVCHEKP